MSKKLIHVGVCSSGSFLSILLPLAMVWMHSAPSSSRAFIISAKQLLSVNNNIYYKLRSRQRDSKTPRQHAHGHQSSLSRMIQMSKDFNSDFILRREHAHTRVRSHLTHRGLEQQGVATPSPFTAPPGTRLGLLFPVGLPGSWPVSVTPVALGSLGRNVTHCTWTALIWRKPDPAGQRHWAQCFLPSVLPALHTGVRNGILHKWFYVGGYWEKKKPSITAAPQWVIHKCSLLQKKIQISNKLWKCMET